MIRAAILALILGLPAQAQESRIVALGLGRSRLEWVLEERLALRPDDESRVKIGQLSFRERWLQRELPRLVDGIESIDMLERVLARHDAQGLAATRDRVLEVSGSDVAVAAVQAELKRLLKRSDLKIRARVWIVLWRSPTNRIPSPLIELITDESLPRHMEELSSSESAQIIETAELNFANGHESSIKVGNRIDYVQDYRLSASAGSLFVEPVMASFQEGLTWSLGAVQESESGEIHLESEFRVTRSLRPMAKLTGHVGPDRQLLTVEKPVLAVSSWATERLVLGPQQRAFRVSGVQLADPNLKPGEVPQRIEILCQIEVLNPQPKDLAGVVQGFDTEAQLAFVRLDDSGRIAGDVVIFEREGQKIAEGRIEEILGSLATVRVTDGEPRMGDQLK